MKETITTIIGIGSKTEMMIGCEEIVIIMKEWDLHPTQKS